MRRTWKAMMAGLMLMGGVAVAQQEPSGQMGEMQPPAPAGQQGACPCPMGQGQGAGPGARGHFMANSADANVQYTNDGAIIRLRARDPSQVYQVQRMARHMGRYVSGTPQPLPPSPPPAPPPPSETP